MLCTPSVKFQVDTHILTYVGTHADTHTFTHTLFTHTYTHACICIAGTIPDAGVSQAHLTLFQAWKNKPRYHLFQKVTVWLPKLRRSCPLGSRLCLSWIGVFPPNIAEKRPPNLRRQTFWVQVVPKLNWSCPSDATWVNPLSSLACTNADQVGERTPLLDKWYTSTEDVF